MPRSQIVDQAKGYKEMVLKKPDKAREMLAQAFTEKKVEIFLHHFLPKFLHITNEGQAKPVNGFLSTDDRTSKFYYCPIRSILQKK